jgi:DNA-binding SARP family transcriptional activator/tetratricopeptide (TPR) repeat protein
MTAANETPEELLERAWVLEPLARFAERTAALDRLEALLDAGSAPAEPPGRDWRLELAAERAVDAGRMFRLEEALRLAREVLKKADPSHEIALGRAQLAAGQALAWTGTEAASREADRAFADAAERFAALGNREWQGSALLRCGYSVWFQSIGDIPRAEELIREALDTYEPGSNRIAAALCYYADVLVDLGEFDEADRILDEARVLAERDLPKALDEIAWTRAHVATGRGDARATERLLREAERVSTGSEWFEGHAGDSLLLEAAEMLDRVGLTDQANEYFERGRERAGDGNEEVMQTRAALLARSGDPLEALDALQELVRGDWLEKRRVWRHLLLTAWATFRAGRGGAGELAARAFEQAIACGGMRIARAGEAELTAALAPLAEQAGSAPAQELLLDGRGLMVRLFGTARVVGADGSELELPAGKPGELVRMLALHEHGLQVEVVLEAFFPDTAPSVGRQRLRQVLTRLRAAVGPIVVRDEDHLRLIRAWVDVREYLAATDRVRSARGPRAVRLAYAALALHSAPLLPTDRYAAWADEIRDVVEYRLLATLDLLANDAVARGSLQEALTALEAATQHDPGNPEREARIAQQLKELGRTHTAEYLARRAERPNR